MIAYRLGSPKHPLLDGTGAATRHDARWNTQGRYVIYAAEHYATAILEIAAQWNSMKVPRTLVYARIDLPPDASIEELRPEDLPGWDCDGRRASQHFGDAWYDNKRSLVLLVPSMAAPGIERNVLINQRHPQFPGVIATGPAPLVCHPKLMA